MKTVNNPAVSRIFRSAVSAAKENLYADPHTMNAVETLGEPFMHGIQRCWITYGSIQGASGVVCWGLNTHSENSRPCSLLLAGLASLGLRRRRDRSNET